MKERSLEKRPVFALSLLFSFCIVFGIASIVAYNSYTKAIKAAVRSNETRANLFAKLILEHQRAAIGVLRSYAGRLSLMHSVKRKDFEGALRNLTDLAKNNPEAEWPFIANPDSTVWINFPVDKRSFNKDLSHRDWYKGIKREWKPYVSGVFKLIVGEEDLGVAVCAPIFDEKGKVIGILGTTQSTAFFRKIIGEVGLNLDAHITLTDREGHIIYSNRFPYRKEVIGYPSFESIKRATKREKGDVEIRDPSDGDRIKYVSFAPVEGIGWSIIVEKAKSEVLRSEYSHFVLIAAISFLICVVVALSLVHLREKQRKLAELAKLNTELDERVRQRASELEAKNQSLNSEITERKQAEKELREKEMFNFALFQYNPIQTIVVDLEGKVIKSNLAKKRAGDRLPNVGDVMYKDYAKSREIDMYGEMMKCIRSGEIGEFPEQKYRGKVLSITISPFPKGAVITSQDITDRKESEEALRESERKFQRLFDEAPVGYHEFDNQGRITRVNKTELEMLGFTIDEMLGQPVWKFIAEGEISRQAVLDKLAGVLPPGRGFERSYRRKDGTTFPALVEDRLFRDPEGRIISIFSTIQDITERKRAEQEMAKLQEQFLQAQKMEAIGHLAGGIAHDFNNLLTVILGYSQISLMDLGEDSPFRENIEEIRQAAERAANLTRQLLAFSRRQILEMKVLDLNSIVKDLDKMLRRVIGEDIELSVLFSGDSGRVNVDRGQMEQVLVNLAVNAQDAMPSGGTLVIETANVDLDEAYARNHVSVKPGHYVMLSVTDTGVGMSPEVMKQIFEPFFTTKERGKGTGLGLSTAYGIVKQSGGNIWVYSEPGKGTTFKIYLPRVEESLEETSEKKAKKELPGGGETLLVVEDEGIVRKLTVRLLRQQGYQVLEARHWEEAITLCKESQDPIHLILTDVVMPGVNGPHLMERLKEVRQDFKVIYMSGYADNTVVKLGILDQGIPFLQKPFTQNSLLHKVREVLDQ